ncbi:MAG: alpha/beta hydrolase fold protein [Mycobacterium sp.]|nr:alpha/beta hydrolase fold protein [Mycobacterium sp.]
MSLPALVLVHGGAHAADCWDLTIDEIHRRAPELTVLAVDLPGRRGKPGDLWTLTIADWVDSVVADIEDAGLDDVVIVGHSMAGLTVPGVVTKLGASRVREMILAAACVPPEGVAMVDALSGPLALGARWNSKKGAPYEWPPMVPRFVFLNGVPRARRRFMTGRLYPESSRITVEKVSRRGMPGDVLRTWILTRRDRIHPVKEQLASIEAIGGVQKVIEMNTCHGLMVSEPERLAEILVERCRARQ